MKYMRAALLTWLVFFMVLPILQIVLGDQLTAYMGYVLALLIVYTVFEFMIVGYITFDRWAKEEKRRRKSSKVMPTPEPQYPPVMPMSDPPQPAVQKNSIRERKTQ